MAISLNAPAELDEACREREKSEGQRDECDIHGDLDSITRLAIALNSEDDPPNLSSREDRKDGGEAELAVAPRPADRESNQGNQACEEQDSV